MLAAAVAFLSILCVCVLVLLVLFEPGLSYRVVARDGAPDLIRSEAIMGVLVDSEVHRAATVQALRNGAAFYAAEIEAIEAARRSVHIEAFIFHRSAIADRFLQALEAAARRVVHVRIVVDAIGSFPTPDPYFDRLRAAGGQVAWYQPIRWYTLKRFNNRSHRELVVVDGAVGFIGGAGIAAHWDEPQAGGQRGAAPWFA